MVTRRHNRLIRRLSARIGAPPIHMRPGRATVRDARFLVFAAVALWGAYVISQVRVLLQSGPGPRAVAENLLFVAVITILSASGLHYLLARLGGFVRMADHHRTPRSIIDATYDVGWPDVTVIVPSYREDATVIRQTLWSAALQEYPTLRVVLLIDDPEPTTDDHRLLLEAARAVPREIQAALTTPTRQAAAALAALAWTPDQPDRPATSDELLLVASAYDDAANTLTGFAARHPVSDRADVFLAEEVFLTLAEEFRDIAHAIGSALDERASVSVRRCRALLARLHATFDAQLSSFERKQYVSLSAEANKAMNLNSYLGLMGGQYRIHRSPRGKVLIPVDEGGDLVVPAATYVLTLDADSMLLPEYCLRLVHHLEQPANERIAVAQTPYSSYRKAPSAIERVAAATTDLQHLVHQGMTHYDGTFWVGANAMIRTAALDDIVEIDQQGGFEIRRYVQDHTVIEDTESSIDLRTHGWQLYNYPERLAYSATPPDFGSLCVQRKRWANGGLLIARKLRGMVSKERAAGHRVRRLELFIRLGYLVSIATSSFGLLVLLLFPFDRRSTTVMAAATVIPYFLAMTSDLRRVGYHRRDILRIYAFNLLLLPVNLAGVMQSIAQGIGGQKIAFARTPKVKDRTVSPLSYLVLPLVIILWSLHVMAIDWSDQQWVHFGFATANVVMMVYALARFVGPWHFVTDLAMNLWELAQTRPRAARRAPSERDWVTVLYHGSPQDEEGDLVTPWASALAAQDDHAELAAVGSARVVDLTATSVVASSEGSLR